MFCPRCGQQQATDSMRFCSRCGFSLEGTMHLLAHGGMLPMYQPPVDGKTISPRRKGVKQGALLMLIGAVLVPVFGVMSGFAPGRLENVFAFFAAISALICFLGGPLRMLFAAIFEEGAKPQYQFSPRPNYAPPAIPQARVSALPPAAASPAAQWRQRPQTAEIVAPPSVTDSTTKLLDKEPKIE
ncbi:MAG TPA: zinc ribbon domain-containing protein [Pyrinomonadaceae bacterium]|nr:zinc ribbon domain-containing protein [Pyrinomonadaceae bacterium]